MLIFRIIDVASFAGFADVVFQNAIWHSGTIVKEGTMRRRQMLGLSLAALAAASLAARAQPERRLRRIGYISGSNVQANANWLAAFREGMAELRWVEGATT